jgi:hypothetical protein
MLVQPLVAMLLTVTVSTTVTVPLKSGAGHATAQAKRAAVQPLVSAATDCIMRTVGADPRLNKSITARGLGDLIVDAVPPCIAQVRAMIDAYDRNYGQGTGDTFFFGPYLDVLPTAVSNAVLGTSR